MTTWSNWSGLEHAAPHRDVTPTDTGAVVAAVQEARAAGRTVKMVGTGHSFTGIAAPEDAVLRPDRMRGILSVDRVAMTVTALAGTQLKVLNAELARMGLTLHNMGDIAEQTLAGATSTGTHGTGGVTAGLAAQVTGLELVTGTGDLLRADAAENPDVLDVARLGLGALGIITSVTFAVEPLFLLEASERPATWAEGVAGFDELVEDNHHCDMYWFPHTDRMLLKTNNRLDADPSTARPLSRPREWFDDRFLSNTLFGALHGVTNRVPGVVPRLNRMTSRMLTARSYSDVAHRVFTTERSVVFREMEYAVPRAAGMAALAEARRVIDASDWRITFPVEIRYARADDVPLSTAYGRESVYLAFHTHRDVDHTAYFREVEAVLRHHDGRPHWGKIHTRTADHLAPAYPRFGDFLALRDRLDPDRVFANAYLRRVLGD